MAAKAADKKTLALIEEVRRRRKDIAESEKPAFRTNCSFSYSEGKQSDTVNLHVERDLQTLIKIVGFISGKRQEYEYAVGALGIENAPAFTWNGYSAEDWTGDVKLRIGKIQVNAKRQKLAELESRLNQIVSPELRQQMELEAIAKELV